MAVATRAKFPEAAYSILGDIIVRHIGFGRGFYSPPPLAQNVSGKRLAHPNRAKLSEAIKRAAQDPNVVGLMSRDQRALLTDTAIARQVAGVMSFYRRNGEA